MWNLSQTTNMIFSNESVMKTVLEFAECVKEN